MTDKYLCHLLPLRKEVVKQWEIVYIDYGTKSIVIYAILEKTSPSILQQNFISYYIR